MLVPCSPATQPAPVSRWHATRQAGHSGSFSRACRCRGISGTAEQSCRRMQQQIGTLGHEDGTFGHGCRKRRPWAGALRSGFKEVTERMNAIGPEMTENRSLQRQVAGADQRRVSTPGGESPPDQDQQSGRCRRLPVVSLAAAGSCNEFRRRRRRCRRCSAG